MDDVTPEERKRLEEVAGRYIHHNCDTNLWAAVDAVLDELSAMGYVLTKRIPHEGKVR